MQADSWSLAVEPNFLQTLHKDLIKQQDVIYGTATVTKHTHKMWTRYTCGRFKLGALTASRRVGIFARLFVQESFCQVWHMPSPF